MTLKPILYIAYVVVLVACTPGLSPEQQAQIQALQVELDATKKEVAAAEAKNVQYSGGAIKAFIELRLEILKTNEALLQQRIQAIESGAKITIQTPVTNPDPERATVLKLELAKQELKVSEAEKKATASSGGLVGAMAQMSAITEANTLSMLRQQYLIAKYGLATPKYEINASSPTSIEKQESKANSDQDKADPNKQLKLEIISATILHKKYAKQDYQDYVWFDVKFDAIGLDKPARAIKGMLIFTDLFDEQKFALRWTIDKSIAPGGSYIEKGSGFEYNQFKDSHQWVRATDTKSMKVVFSVNNILYEDGTTREF